MIIDSHVHIFSYPSWRDLSPYIKTMEDALKFRTRYPELNNCSITEQPIDSTDELVADMDKNGIDFAILQERAGQVSISHIAGAAGRYPSRMVSLARVGHDQEVSGYHDDPGPTREA